MIDRELMTRKAVLILEDLPAVEELARRPLAEYLESRSDEFVAERYLQRMITRMISVNYHLLTESGKAPPRDYYQSFLALAPLGVIDDELARRLAPLAGLRNRLIHEYFLEDIDPTKVHQALDLMVRDLPPYLEAVRRFVDRAADGS